MRHLITIIFGKEQVIKTYNNIEITQEEKENFIKQYSFETLEEKNAFLKGISEAIGWTDYCIPELELINF